MALKAIKNGKNIIAVKKKKGRRKKRVNSRTHVNI